MKMTKLIISALTLVLLVLWSEAKKAEKLPEAPVPIQQAAKLQQPHVHQEPVVEEQQQKDQHNRIKPPKTKSLKALTEYELCKQECKRRRDQDSLGQYVDWLREELTFAEEQMRTQAEAEQQQQTQ